MYKLNFLICVLHQKDIRDLQPLNKAYFPIALHEQKKSGGVGGGISLSEEKQEQ
jgi:hypothetical protein